MPKIITIFVEGQGEQIFIRNILLQLYNPNTISFKCIQLHAENYNEVPYSYGNKEQSKIHFMIINVEGDEKLLSHIQEREKAILAKGCIKIIGLRDMYSEKYKKRATEINPDVNKLFIDNCNKITSQMSEPEKISIHFAIMEIESWWLSMHTLFEKIDSSLTSDYIFNQMEIRLNDINIEECIFHPYPKLKKLLESIGKTYNKHSGEVESITSHITVEDIEAGISNGRCQSLKKFYKELSSF